MKKLVVVCLLSVFMLPTFSYAESLDVVSDGVVVNNYSGLTPKSTIHIYDATEAGVAMQTNDQGGTAGTGKIRVDHSPNSPSGGYSGQVVVEPYGYNDGTSTYEFFENMLVVDENGVGLGTDDPELNLHIYDVNADEDDQAGILLRTESGTSDLASGRVVVRHSDTYAESDRGQIVIEPKDSVGFVENAFVVDPLGVGIGTIPTSPFDVYDYMTVTNSYNQLLIAPHAFNFNGTNFFALFPTDSNWVFKFGGTEKIRFTKDGISYNGGATFITSDIRSKTDVRPLKNSLEKLKSITPISFKYKGSSTPKIGLSAQEVEKVFPQLVKENEEGIRSLDYSSLIAPLVGAVAEQQKIIEKQNQAITKLEGKLEESLQKLVSIEEEIRNHARTPVGVSYSTN